MPLDPTQEIIFPPELMVYSACQPQSGSTAKITTTTMNSLSFNISFTFSLKLNWVKIAHKILIWFVSVNICSHVAITNQGSVFKWTIIQMWCSSESFPASTTAAEISWRKSFMDSAQHPDGTPGAEGIVSYSQVGGGEHWSWWDFQLKSVASLYYTKNIYFTAVASPLNKYELIEMQDVICQLFYLGITFIYLNLVEGSFYWLMFLFVLTYLLLRYWDEIQELPVPCDLSTNLHPGTQQHPVHWDW